MKKIYIFIVLAKLFFVSIFAQSPSQNDKNWRVVFEDDFSTDFIYSWGNERWYKGDNIHIHENGVVELQHYIHSNVEIINDKLVLTAKYENYTCTRPNCNCNNGTFNYTSGKISSNNKYKYGYFEVYAKLPTGTAFFPAFWLWDASFEEPCFYNEIDIMEAEGCDPTWSSSNFGAYFNCIKEERHAIPHPCNYANGSYHWFGVEWDSLKITWHVDRKIVRQIPNNEKGIGIQNPLGIKINLSLFPPEWGTCVPINNALFPNSMLVDLCNVYQLKYDCSKNETINSFSDFANYYYAVKKSITLSGNTILPSGSDISLRATDYIELQNGFTVNEGAELYLDNNPCEVVSTVRVREE
jgi:beta-glucanase (GH16 family)